MSRFEEFAALHVQGNPVMLYNVWDVGSALAVIAAARRSVGEAFFINARTDLFLKAKPEDHDDALVDQAIERGKAFAGAGANGFFVPRLGDLRLVERVVKAVPLPVNAIAYPGAPSKAEWASAGIARISHGPFPHKALMAQLTEAAKAAIG